MIKQILALTSSWEHFVHPFHLPGEQSKKISKKERLGMVTLVALFSLATLGGFAAFSIGSAIWKSKKIKQMQPDPPLPTRIHPPPSRTGKQARRTCGNRNLSAGRKGANI